MFGRELTFRIGAGKTYDIRSLYLFSNCLRAEVYFLYNYEWMRSAVDSSARKRFSLFLTPPPLNGTGDLCLPASFWKFLFILYLPPTPLTPIIIFIITPSSKEETRALRARRKEEKKKSKSSLSLPVCWDIADWLMRLSLYFSPDWMEKLTECGFHAKARQLS